MRIEMQTSMGNFILELYPEQAPKTVENFLSYVRSGFFEKTLFHRVIDKFMIQGGGFEANLVHKPTGNPIENEANNGIANEKGTIAMARTMDPHSATSQFFINVADNAFLNYRSSDVQGFGYCAFGRVIEGYDVVEKISRVKTGRMHQHQDVPVEDIMILAVKELPEEA